MLFFPFPSNVINFPFIEVKRLFAVLELVCMFIGTYKRGVTEREVEKEKKEEEDEEEGLNGYKIQSRVEKLKFNRCKVKLACKM